MRCRARAAYYHAALRWHRAASHVRIKTRHSVAASHLVVGDVSSTVRRCVVIRSAPRGMASRKRLLACIKDISIKENNQHGIKTGIIDRQL